MCDVEVGKVAKVLWGSGFGKRRVGGDTFNISEPRLGMGGRGGSTIEGGVTHSRNWQREGATRGRCTLCEVCNGCRSRTANSRSLSTHRKRVHNRRGAQVGIEVGI